MRYYNISIYCLIATICIFFSSCAKDLVGDGNVIEQTRNDFDKFNEVQNEEDFDVEIVFSKDYAVVIQAEANVVNKIATKIRSGKLVIKWKENFNLTSDYGVSITVYMPFCEQVLNYGSGNVHIMDPVSEIFRINNSSSGNIVVEDLESSEVRIRNSSWGKVIVTGYTGSINIKNTSIGTVDCYSLLGQCATVRNESSGRVVINVTDWAEIWSKHYYSVEVFGNGANNVSWYPLDDD